MRPLGYLYKKVATRPEWLGAPSVADVYSLSGCISEPFLDYVSYWRHNGFWLFDAPSVMEAMAAENGLDLTGLKLFYYEALEQQFDEKAGRWLAYEPERSAVTAVREPDLKTLEGFDVVSYYVQTTPECSPLSCNSLAAHCKTNAHCLFETVEEAVQAVTGDLFRNSEPGPFRIVAVYSVP